MAFPVSAVMHIALLKTEMGTESEANQQASESNLRGFPSFCDIYRSFLHDLGDLSTRTAEILRKSYKKVLEAVGPKVGGKPSNHTVVWAFFIFTFFLVFASLAVRFPTHNVKIAFVTVSSTMICALCVLMGRDFVTAPEGQTPSHLNSPPKLA